MTSIIRVPKRKTHRIVKELGAGTLGGALQAVVGHPLDLIKVRMQAAPQHFPSTIATVQSILRNESIAGFFKGLSIPLISCGFTNATLFTFYGTSKRVVASTYNVENVADLSLSQVCISSWLSAPFYCLVLCPIEVLKCNLQYQSNTTELRYNGPLQAARALGTRGLLKGYLPTLGTRMIGSPFYFCSYEATKNLLINEGNVDEKSMTIGLLSGFAAGICFWSANFPVDLIKTRMQLSSSKSKMNPWQVAREIFGKEGGLFGLYRGFLPCILRAGPANAVAFGGYEFGMRCFSDE
jgi:solute carrier family 25 carnitine/acylcarnitine transporter 20/29